MNPDQTGSGDEDGLCGIVHYLGRPVSEAGGYLYVMDFGSAPPSAITDLLDVLAKMGTQRVELGLSDGSDLPPDALKVLRNPELTLEDLTTIIGKLLLGAEGVVRVEQVAADALAVYTADGGPGARVFTSNLYRLLLRSGIEARAKEVYRFVRGQRETVAGDETPDLEQLRPTIKDDRYFQNLQEMMPDMKEVVRVHLAADLWLTCVWDAPNGMRFVTAEEPGIYGLSSEQFIARARENFLNGHPPPEVSSHGILLVAKTNDCYDASLLLDDGWLDAMESRVDGEMVACVPTRNVLLIGGLANPRTLPEMNAVAMRVEEGGDHLISSTILVRRQGKWIECEQSRDLNPVPSKRVTSEMPRSRPWWKFW